MWERFFSYSARVGGPVHIRAAARASGLRPEAIVARATREGWWRPFPTVVAPPGVVPSGPTWAAAALARARGPFPDDPLPAGLIRFSGLAAYGVASTWPTRVQIAVPSTQGPRGDRRLQVVRSRSFPADALARRGDVDVPPPAWLLRDLASVAATDLLTNVTIDLAQRRLLALDDLAASLEEHRRFPGRGKLVEVLARLDAAGRTDSPLELAMRDRLLAAGVPLDEGQVEVPCVDGRSIWFDLGVSAARFVIDCESMLAHAHRIQLRSDIRRTNQVALVPDDWRVLRATWEDLEPRGWPPFLELATKVLRQQSIRWLDRDWPA